ncbi:MAG: RagB/SusD family nutrient uptake outer membrane protein [Agriterribacter sp.]
MKRFKNKYWGIPVSVVLVVALYACNKSFLERPPIGEINETSLNNKDGVNGLLIGAYALLDGAGINGIDNMRTSVWNAWLGSVASDDAKKGGNYTSQPDRAEVENYTYTPFNDILRDRWRLYYAGVQRANETIRLLDKLDPGVLTEAEALQIRAEARFLRGVYHFEAIKTWRNIPYVDETITFQAGNYKVKNDVSAWPKVEDDFKFAADNLTAVKEQIGRANSWAAKAFLAKCYMFQAKFADAKPLLEDIINNGVTAGNVKYNLAPKFSELFRAPTENQAECVFAVQMSVNDGASGENGNTGETMNQFPPLKPILGIDAWGHQPSMNLVNAYKTENGLPLIEDFNDVNVTNDMGLAANAPFTPYGGTLDPRLDWTVARRAVPVHDWGLLQKWVPDDLCGPYRTKKVLPWSADGSSGYEVIGGWLLASAVNFNMIRFADVLLWAAEVEVEIGSLEKAQEYVNRVRARAANPADFLRTYVDPANPASGFTNTPAANYDIEEYPAGHFTTIGKDESRKAVRFERRLELATEGHRFFDLQRYELVTPGQMATTLNNYMQSENQFNIAATGHPYELYVGKSFKPGFEVYAIPQAEIDATVQNGVKTLTQNQGH